MSASVNREQIGCTKAGKQIPLNDAIEIFDDKCDSLDCPQYFTCRAYGDNVRQLSESANKHG